MQILLGSRGQNGMGRHLGQFAHDRGSVRRHAHIPSGAQARVAVSSTRHLLLVTYPLDREDQQLGKRALSRLDRSQLFHES